MPPQSLKKRRPTKRKKSNPSAEPATLRSQRRLRAGPSRSGKRTRTYSIARPAVRLSPAPLAGLWQVRGGTILSLFLLAFLGVIMGRLFTAYTFYVYEAEVRGSQFINPEEIYSVSGLNELSIFWINPEKAEEAILSRLPGIKEVKVTCRLPNRVTIDVVERQVKVAWEWGGNRYGVDEHGAILPLGGEWEGMLHIQDLSPVAPDVRGRIDREVIRSALELARLLPEANVLQYSDDRGLTLYRDGHPIYFGSGEIADKIKIMDALLQELAYEGRHFEYVDVRFLDSPCYK